MKITHISSEHTVAGKTGLLFDPPMTSEIFEEFKRMCGEAILSEFKFQLVGNCLIVQYATADPTVPGGIIRLAESAYKVIQARRAAEKLAKHQAIQAASELFGVPPN